MKHLLPYKANETYIYSVKDFAYKVELVFLKIQIFHIVVMTLEI